MIHFVLLQNRQGKTRLAKYYAVYDDEDKRYLESEVFRLIVSRPKEYTHFVEFRNIKLIYRRYAGLYFIIGCDINDNELAFLEVIHLFVETLDEYFGNVCELDLVFNFYKVYAIADEIFMGGEIQETSRTVVLNRLAEIEREE
ncbi:putative AP-2 complex subunit sigma [Paratrimastix pyriformis]|uniref:AP complex subunit sigma n=1 Tax=Paratrimastix pyriformis TaxID=342808 RepID=A0ABQ8UED3_9EUKA|nr:putative AP-2 complex subunit sigma [Paratrimastix pyriformis]|eukprot:GAFH01005483.1.p1 GENE.GAFH01005483.1~~GAFH01005483.1.p1  ORF type:complete len:143 (-),score=32.70 GAFH01005483.1:155-583(-)